MGPGHSGSFCLGAEVEFLVYTWSDFCLRDRVCCLRVSIRFGWLRGTWWLTGLANDAKVLVSPVAESGWDFPFWTSSSHSFSFISAATAKSLQSCPTLCDPIDSSPPGAPVPGILQARASSLVGL